MANEKRLIDANLLVKDLEFLAKHEDSFRQSVILGVVQTVNTRPTVDAVHVVRCRECVHWKPTESKAGNSFSDMEYIGGCEFTNYCRRESDFCSYGERKDGDGNG